MKSSKVKGPANFQMVSPATKLLEKRRKMYEIHEAFESQKDEFKKYDRFPSTKSESLKRILNYLSNFHIVNILTALFFKT